MTLILCSAIPMPSLPDDPAAAVLDLFTHDLANVQFPDVGRDVLEQAHGSVQRALAELAEAEALLEAAHASLLLRQDELAQKATRALAYARIYAESDDALAEKVASIAALPGLSPRNAGRRQGDALTMQNANAAPRRRGRPAKTQPGQTALAPSLASGIDSAQGAAPEIELGEEDVSAAE